MSSVRICDQRDCPAHALHDVDLYGQDFHFCGHHWAELRPIVMAQISPWERERGPEPSGRRGTHPRETVTGRR